MLHPPNRRRSDADGHDPRTLRVLVVDDDESYRTYLGALLRRFGFAVTHASDGREALRIVGDVPAFDLLIIDCEMPRMDGLTFISQLRTHERGADVFALMITGRDDVETKVNALALGYDDFIRKSGNEAELAAKLGAARRVVARQQRLDDAVRELYGLATRDELTGLLNRRFFFEEASRQLASGADISFVLFDLDGFKQVNDHFGHLAGDRILRDVGALFLRRTRHEDLIARFGGDEFVMLVGGLKVLEVETIAGRIAQEIGTMQWTIGVESMRVGISYGIACSSMMETPTMEGLLEAGDRDLYKNKWMRHHPEADPSLYEYPAARSENVLRFEIQQRASTRQANED